MKVRYDARDFAGPDVRFNMCLLYGTDVELVEERSAELTRKVAGSLGDPFRVVTLSLEDQYRLPAEASARSLSGGRRVIRVRDCGERILTSLTGIDPGEKDDAAIVLHAGSLTKRSKLRLWAEDAKHVAVVVCNVDDASQRRRLIEATLLQAGVTISRDGLDMLVDRIPPGRQAMANELDKLCLLADGQPLDRTIVEQMIDIGFATTYAAIDAALAGYGPAASTACQKAFEGGAAGVGFARMLGSEVDRLSIARDAIGKGASVRDALERIGIYARTPRFVHWNDALRRTTIRGIRNLNRLVHAAERDCKSAGSDERLVTAALLEQVVTELSA